MPIEPIVQELQPAELEIGQLFLDPNNPRFVTSGWTPVADGDIDQEAVQEEVRIRMVKDFDVDRLRRNIEVNGYLPIDRVIVRRFKPDRYVVLEGNRRICAAKLIAGVNPVGEDIREEVTASLRRIPCLIYTGGNPRAAWVFQGIRHISGFVDWSSFNKAKLMVEQMEESGLTLTEVGKRFGISGPGAGQWVRGFKAFKQAAALPEFQQHVNQDAYPFFMELFSRSSGPVRNWLAWSDQALQFQNDVTLAEFLDWLYPLPEPEAVPEGQRPQRDWEKRALTRRDDLRQVAYLISEAPDFFEKFRDDHDIERAYSEARAKKYQETLARRVDALDETIRAVDACAEALTKVPWGVMMDPTKKARLLERFAPLKAVIQQMEA